VELLSRAGCTHGVRSRRVLRDVVVMQIREGAGRIQRMVIGGYRLR
jgi:alkylation response protein AidB-like acyl-CoA dehydrogenase